AQRPMATDVPPEYLQQRAMASDQPRPMPQGRPDYRQAPGEVPQEYQQSNYDQPRPMPQGPVPQAPSHRPVAPPARPRNDAAPVSPYANRQYAPEAVPAGVQQTSASMPPAPMSRMAPAPASRVPPPEPVERTPEITPALQSYLRQRIYQVG